MWGYLWFWGPAGMQPQVVDTLYRHLAFAIKHPDTVKLFGDGGSEASGMTPAEMAKEVKRLDQAWGAVIREVGVKLDQ
jgi:tripartite-type tricarboxylate transporter receptor subunit TctC